MAEVIGVVGDVRSRELAKANDVEFYRPSPQRSFSFFNLVVRTSVNPETAAPMVRAALDKIDKEIPILQPNTLDTIITQSLGQRRLTMGLLGAFAGVALLLAVVGIYGAVAYTVEQRTAEIGVRMALGAQVKDVLRLVVRQGMNPVLIGLGLGLVAIFGTGRFLTAQLYQISPHNPILLALTAAPLPIANANRLVRLYEAADDNGARGSTLNLSEQTFRQWREFGGDIFEGVASATGTNVTVGAIGSNPARSVAAARISANFFSIVGLPPALGRAFTAEEDVEGGPKVVIISDDFWRQQLNGRADVLGTTISIDGNVHTIVGVMPKMFRHPYRAY